MSRKVLLLNHMEGERIDRAHPMLVRRGFEIEWCAPALGDVLPDPLSDAFDAVVVYGGAQSANDDGYIQDEVEWIRTWVEADKPFMGFCLGAQLLSLAFGGEVRPHPTGLYEIGFFPIETVAPGFKGPHSLVYHWHKEGFTVPRTGELLARGDTFPNQAFRIGRKAYGLQFHPEVTQNQMQTWMDSAGHMLAHPGAQDRERQLADARHHIAPLGDWLEAFLDRWLSDSGLTYPARSSTAAGELLPSERVPSS